MDTRRPDPRDGQKGGFPRPAHNITPMKSEQPRVLPARAKINLCLDIRGRRPDGYHELDTVFQRLALHDTVVLYPAETGITVNSDRPDLPAGPKNIAYRAAELLGQEYGVRRGVRIRLRKRIPIAAGLGGGSADAAAVLRGLPSIWGLPSMPARPFAGFGRATGRRCAVLPDGRHGQGRGNWGSAHSVARLHRLRGSIGQAGGKTCDRPGLCPIRAG